MAAWSDETMAVPVDADARVSKTFVATVERDVVINLAFVIFRIPLRAGHTGFFVSREDENEIALRLDLRCIEGANSCEQRFDVACVVADSGSVEAPVANGCLDLQSGLKDRVHVRIKDRHWTTATAFASGNQITGCVVTDVEVVFAQQALDKFCAFLFMF